MPTARKPRFEWGRTIPPSLENMPAREEYEGLYQELVSDALVKAQNRLGWDLRMIAEESGLSYSTVRRLSRFETFYPRWDTLFKLTRAVGMQIKFSRPAQPAKVVRRHTAAA